MEMRAIGNDNGNGGGQKQQQQKQKETTLADEGIVGETTGTVRMTTTIREVSSVVKSQ